MLRHRTGQWDVPLDPWHRKFKRTESRWRTWVRCMQPRGIFYGDRIFSRKKLTALWFPPASKRRKLHDNSGWDSSCCAFSYKGEEQILQKQVECFDINRANKWVRVFSATSPTKKRCPISLRFCPTAKHCPCHARLKSLPQRSHLLCVSEALPVLRLTDTAEKLFLPDSSWEPPTPTFLRNATCWEITRHEGATPPQHWTTDLRDNFLSAECKLVNF